MCAVSPCLAADIGMQVDVKGKHTRQVVVIELAALIRQNGFCNIEALERRLHVICNGEGDVFVVRVQRACRGIDRLNHPSVVFFLLRHGIGNAARDIGEGDHPAALEGDVRNAVRKSRVTEDLIARETAAAERGHLSCGCW